MKKHNIILMFSLVFALKSIAQNTIQTVTNPTTSPQPTAIGHPCQNIGFESLPVGSYTSIPEWTLASSGYTNSLINGYCFSYSIVDSTNSNSMVITIPATVSPIQPTLIPLSPFSGNHAFYITSQPAATGVVAAQRNFSVLAGNPFFEYAYIFSIAHSHAMCCDAAYIKVRLLDNLGNAISCGSVVISGATGGGTACVNPNSVPTLTNFPYVYTPSWVVNTFDLSPYIGTNVTLKLEAGSCNVGGHHSYIWFDGNCFGKMITSNGTVSGNTTTVCQNSNVATLTTMSSNSFTWSGPATSTISNNSSASMSTSISGVYSLSIFNPNCGSTNTYTYQVNFCTTTGMNESENDRFSVFPNPGNGEITILGNVTSELTVRDISGRKIDTITLNSENNFTRNISDLKKGIYFVSGGGIRQKIIVLE